MMSKRTIYGIVTAVIVMVALTFAVFATGWGDIVTYDWPQSMPTFNPIDGSGNLLAGSLTYVVFETYGPIVALLALIMFGAMVGAICVAKEEVDDDDSN
ncbi:MAG: hypothetical protein VB016_02315 [Methanomassiliicoccaceae archaeon]|nr:hypothetical protein [Methanomassiliicoccaceae archaeon]